MLETNVVSRFYIFIRVRTIDVENLLLFLICKRMLHSFLVKFMHFKLIDYFDS